jgi:hypothetical protein
MAWAGGQFTRANGATEWRDDANLGTGIEPGLHDAQDNDLADGINQCINKDGSNAFTGNANLGGFKATNIAAATLRTDAPQVAQVQDGDFIWLGTTSGTATAQTASASPALAAYKAGQKFRMKIGAGLGSTTAAGALHTLNINSLGVKAILDQTEANPSAGNWIAGAIMEVVYNGTAFIITNDPSGWQTWSPTLAISVGTISNINITWARYIKQNKKVTLQLSSIFTLNGGSPYLEVTGLPVNLQSPVAGVLNWTSLNQVGGVNYVGITYNNSATNLGNLRDVNVSNWGTAADARLFWTITYLGV